jgi:hypothetical protein
VLQIQEWGGRLRNAPKILVRKIERKKELVRLSVYWRTILKWILEEQDGLCVDWLLLAPMSVANTCESGNGMLCFLNGELLLGWLCVFLHVPTVL